MVGERRNYVEREEYANQDSPRDAAAGARASRRRAEHEHGHGRGGAGAEELHLPRLPIAGGLWGGISTGYTSRQ